MKFLIYLVGSLCLAGTQSTILVNGSYAAWPSSPFNSQPNVIWEVRMHNWSAPNSNLTFDCLNAGAACFNLHSDSTLFVDNSKDTVPSSNAVSVAGITDWTARWSRTPTQTVLEVFDNTNGNCLSNTQNITVAGNNNWSGSGAGYGISTFSGVTPKLAFNRFFFGTVATICKNPPSEPDTGCNLICNEFEGNPNDSSGNNITLTFSSTYSTTPTYNPVCSGQDTGINFTPTQTIKLGLLSTITQLGCSSVGAGAAGLNYSWTNSSCPNASYGVSNILNATVIDTVAETCKLNVAISDSVPNTTNVTVTFGVVLTDSNDNVITGSTILDQILGPMKRFGAVLTNAAYEDFNRAWAQLLGNDQTTLAYYNDQFNTSLVGTVTMVNAAGTTTITGIGTDFQNTFCAGGTTQTLNALIIIWVPDGRAVGGTKRVNPQIGNAVVSCVSATVITVTPQYNGPLGTSGMFYSRWDYANNWIGISENIQYYDNCEAFYSMWYRTNITQYL